MVLQQVVTGAGLFAGSVIVFRNLARADDEGGFALTRKPQAA